MDCQVQIFVPRFDRKVSDGRVERLGMHSLNAVANIPGYGAAVRHDTYCHIEDEIIQRLSGWINEVAAGLVEIRPRAWT